MLDFRSIAKRLWALANTPLGKAWLDRFSRALSAPAPALPPTVGQVDKPRCADCLFLQADKSQCRRLPPTVHFDPADAKRLHFLVPGVTADYWCGEFRAKAK